MIAHVRFHTLHAHIKTVSTVVSQTVAVPLLPAPSLLFSHHDQLRSFRDYVDGKMTDHILEAMARNAIAATKQDKRDQITNDISVDELKHNGELFYNYLNRVTCA